MAMHSLSKGIMEGVCNTDSQLLESPNNYGLYCVHDFTSEATINTAV